MGLPRLVALSLTMALPGCLGSSMAGAGAPRNFAAVEVWFGTIVLSWDAASVDGYEMDARLGSGSWQPIAGAIPGDAAGGLISLADTIPEMTPISFRIRAVRAGTRSLYAEADVMHGIHPPESFAVAVGTSSAGGMPLRVGPVTITWTNLSAVATELRLERAASGSVPLAWTTLPASFGATTFVDDTALEGVSYLYQARYGTGGTWSVPSAANAPPIDLKLPSSLTVQAIAGGYRVSWVNRSTTATQLVLGRWLSAPSGAGDPFAPPSGETRITLPATADHYDDLAPTFFPTTRYALRVVRDTATVTVPGPLLGLPPVAVTGPMAFTGTALQTPGGPWVARDDAGRFHFLSRGVALTVSRQTPSGWDTYAIGGWANGWGVAADGQGRTHALFDRGAAGPAGHAWWDGAAWQQEDLPPDACVSESFGVSADGRVHLLCDSYSGTYDYYAGTNPGWSPVETPTFSTVPGFMAWHTHFAVARDGTAYLLGIGTGGTDVPQRTYAVMLKRQSAGGWSEISEEIAASPADWAWVLPAGAGQAAFLYDTRAPDGSEQIFFVQEGPSGFGAPELLVQRPWPMYGTNLTAAISGDGARVHVLLASELDQQPLRLHTRTATGWQSEAFAPSGPFPTGYGPDGKAWVLAGFDLSGTPALSDHALWLED